ncbi:hypothetical protein F1880_010316 [Penicillium rolfsii]|nr:hypothetical protein F1880_010316 [Penicillium rolfsii]
MANPIHVQRAQMLSRKLNLALKDQSTVSSVQKEELCTRMTLLPSAIQDDIVEMQRTRRSRAPSPDDHSFGISDTEHMTCAQVGSSPRIYRPSFR